MRNFMRTVVTGAAAVAIATLSFGTAAMAEYDPNGAGGTVQTNTDNIALINPTATVELSIHKYLGAPVVQEGVTNDGSVQTVNLPALDGVNFDVYRVGNVDLTTNEGWDAAAALYAVPLTQAMIDAGQITVGSVNYPITLVDTVTTGETGVAGEASFVQTNGVGLYLVNENLSTSTSITSAGSAVDKNTITPSAPFLVTLPMTNPDDTTRWMYDVSVYPKNQTDTITKAVVDKGTVTTETDQTYGDAADHALEYVLTSSITDSTDPLGMYVIYDDLDPSVTFTGVSIELSNGTELTRGTDYLVYTAIEYNQPATLWDGAATVAGGPFVTIVMTETGQKALEADRAASVVTTINATVGAEDADGIVPNTAAFIPNETWWQQNDATTNPTPENPTDNNPTTDTKEPGIPSNEVETKYGNVTINKTAADSGAVLPGVGFAVYADADNSDTCTSTDVRPENMLIGELLTDSNGAVTFTGLQVSNFYNGTTQTDPMTYCLVETTAAEGYNLLAEPIPFTISDAGSTLALTTLAVENQPSNLNNNLPLTGGQGALAASGLGLLLVGGGLGYYVINRRKETRA